MMWLNTMNCRMIQFHLNYFIISILLINQLLCNFCAAKQINNTLITKKHNNHDIKRKFTIDELQYMRFPKRISDDIDLDPCKTGGFLGDISMPNQDAEAEWRKQNRRNKDIQADIEKLKQEVYNEGLQVEEEGLTDIVRKKTKLPYQSNENDRLHHNNDPAIYARNSEGPQQKTHSHSRAISSQDYHGSASDIKVVILDNGGQQMSVTHEAIKVVTPESEQPVEKKLNVPPIDSHDHRKIHSDTKSIEDNSGDNLMYDKSISAIPTTTVSSRTTESSYITNDTTTGTKSSVRIRRSRRRREQNTITKKQIDYMGLLTKKYQTLENAKQDLKPLMDIALSSESERTKKIQRQHHRVTRAATAKKERIWDYGVIPYEIDGNFSGAHKTLFKQAMKHWENHTCIKFVERNPAEHPNYIVFTERACGCCSFVGKRGNGAQAISIGKNCDKFGIIVHELGHVVGFWHEHTRPDRDNHVVIERVNIMKGQEYNFNMLTADDVNSLGLPYDYDSIMHYARNTFSKGTFLDTILPIEVVGKKRPEIGQRVKLSEGDISQARLLYNCPKCGRTYQENAGSFTSPSYFSLIPPEEPEICEWRITATHGEKIVLNITDLDIFKSNNCRSDYLEIRDGYWHKSPILGRYCGSGKLNTLITTTGSRMLLSYVTTQRQTNHRGFAVNYEAICGGTLELEQGRLESPNYPLDYLANKECIWKITVPDDFQVALKFQSFEIENHDNCSYDYVEIREGDSPTSRLIGIFCGFKLPPDIRSSTNKMFVKFVSDGSVQKAGFSATFMKEYDECEKLDHGCEHECINLLGGYQCACDIGYELHSDKKSCEDACGGIINDLNGTITSPSFPHEYPSTKECVWEIITPPQYRITMNFTHFDLEGNNFYQQECEYDSLTLYSKLDGDPLKRHGVYCGNRLPPMITSESNTLRIEFRSDKTVQKSGFAAMFFTDIDECAINNGGCQHDCKNTIGSYVCSCHNGFTLHENEHDCKEGGCKYEITTPKGNVYSPNFPDNYPPNKDCVWHFTTTPGHRIKLVFTFFDVEPHQECAYDNVTIYNGDSPESYMLGRFCGGKVPHPISATSNEMYMIFKSDTSVHRKGFKAIHSTSCGGSLVATNLVKHFYSHSKYGDDNYDIDTDCEWTIYAEQGRNVRLTFLTFELESEKNCGFDYVDIFGGYDDYSGTKYGRYCGTTSPPDIISIGEALLVRFRTDASNTFTGFSASYVALDPYSGEITDEESEESYTPFPGSLKSMVISHIDENDENGEDDYDDNSEDYIDYRSVIEKSRSKFKQQEIEVPRNLMSGED